MSEGSEESETGVREQGGEGGPGHVILGFRVPTTTLGFRFPTTILDFRFPTEGSKGE